MVRDHPRRALTFGWEPARRVFDEPNFIDLIKAHWREVGYHHAECPLDPDLDCFAELDERGLYRIWAARNDGALVGYIGWWVQPHLHFRRTLHGIADAYCLTPDERRGMAGFWMIAGAVEAVRELGVKRCVIAFPLGTDLRLILTRLGFEHREEVWDKLL